MDVQRQEGKTAIGIEQIRQAAQFLQQTALYGEIKVMMIRDADQLTLAAANSLLKTLEEPAGNALLLLSTSAVWRLPATVRSRCQQLRLPSARR
jgi:DNA polymerase-3 subunit delta'